MAEAILLSEDRGRVRLLTLNRPEKLNALDGALSTGLLGALESADAAPEIGAIVLAGAGRAFCAGADRAELAAEEDEAALVARTDRTVRLQTILPQLTKPVVGAIHGHALGAGAGLALGCDLVVAAPSLRLGYPETAHGMVPALMFAGLVRQIGPKPAFELIGLGRPIGAERALGLGLVNRIADEATLVDEAVQLAAAMAEVPAATMAATKALFYRLLALPPDEAVRAGTAAYLAIRRGEGTGR